MIGMYMYMHATFNSCALMHVLPMVVVFSGFLVSVRVGRGMFN